MASGTSSPSGLLSLVSDSPTTYGSSTRQKDLSRVGLSGLRKLCALLRNEGHRVLSGQSDFTLTSEVLSHLLVSCRRHSVVLNERASAVPDQPIRTPTFVINRRPVVTQNVDSVEDEWNGHVQFIKDFMLSTPNLKRLLPHVESLDLSHNCLEKCDVYLEYLGDLVYISLAYNLLTSVPSFSLSSRASLVSLILRGNNLDQIKGIENLTVLSELDLGENCISDHSFLEPLLYLTRLSQLQLDSNPLFYHRRHRKLTASCLSRQALSLEFELDKKRLTVSEITYYEPRSLQNKYKTQAAPSEVNNSTGGSSIPERRPSLSSGIGTELERSKRKRLKPRQTEIVETSGDFTSSRDASPGTTPRRNEAMRLRTEEALRTKEQVEELRRHYGPNWLQAIEDRNIFNKDKSDARPQSGEVSKSDNDSISSSGKTKLSKSKSKKKGKQSQHSEALSPASEPTSKTDTGDESVVKSGDERVAVAVHHSQTVGDSTCPSDSDAPTKSERTEVTNPIMAALARLAAQQVEGDVYTASDSQDDRTYSSSKLKEMNSSRDNLTSESESAAGASTLQTDGRLIGPSITASTLTTQIESLSPIKPAEEDGDSSFFKSSQDDSQSADIERSTSHDSSADIYLDEAELTEPMVATLPLQDNKMILVSMSLSYLLEKDIKDKLTEKLELASLLSMESRVVAEGGAGARRDEGNGGGGVGVYRAWSGEEKVELTLKFDYINRDRQKRCYLLDVADSKAITDFLQPFLDARIEAAKLKLAEVMQCLKCNRTFLKRDVLKKKKELPSAGNLQDLKALQELMDKTAFICPKCGSSMVIDYTPSASAATATTASTSSQHGRSASSTPVGSYTSTEGWMDRMKQKQAVKLPHKKASDRIDGRVSQLARKDSTSSLDLARSRKSSVMSNGSVTKDSRTNSVESTRDRSNAFSAANKMSRSVAVTKRERTVSEKGELHLVEDYFEDDSTHSDISSSKLAAMTTSLRGDPSTMGSAATVRRPSLNQASKGGNTEAESQARSIDNASRTCGELVDSGFLSGVNSDSLDQEKLKGSLASGFPNKVGQDQARESGGSGSNSGTERGAADNKRKTSTSSQHKHLSAMEELVNSMVQEGHSIGGWESASQGNLGQKSISVSAFRDLVSSAPSNNRRERTGSRTSSVDVASSASAFQRSDSASSIAVLSRGTSVGDDVNSGVVNFTLGNGPNGAEEGGDWRCPRSGEGEDEVVPRVVSPLSSNICSSMVSSVYESSVRTVTDEDINGLGVDTVSNGCAETTETPTVIDDGSSCSSSSEDMISIYDLPTRPKKSRSKRNSKTSKSKIKSQSFGSYSERSSNQVDGEVSLPQGSIENVTDNVDSAQSVDNGRLDTSSLKQPSSSGQAGYLGADNLNGENDVDSDSETEVLSELDVTPQFAFHHLNHRLTLYLMMTLFEPHEEFVCKIQGEFSQYIIDESYEGIFVMSSARFYILKIMSDDHTQDPSQWVNCIEIQPIPELRYIDLGLGGQSLRLEFVTDCSSYTIITRNRDRTTQFIEVLHTNLAKYAVSNGIASHVVVNEDVDQMTLDNLDKDVLSRATPGQKLLLYCMGFIQRGVTDRFPVSFVISTNDICLVRACHQWPQPRLQAPITVETVGRQFVVLERQLVNNVASVNVDEASMRKISLELFNEKEGVSTHWNITMASRQTTMAHWYTVVVVVVVVVVMSFPVRSLASSVSRSNVDFPR
ncbi:serine/threonine-protein kinase 11-interacting protein [Elysia marginata]|uniref:Serine/threonine-protein kinase 11-interacting protein n=1 Tax=Elysia marginata TaxID=1093978 RepID=A0AAV4INK4_9GAST|nr:serine/threonine-protein kinase 11-interacting protein [Elysia marginata]